MCILYAAQKTHMSASFAVIQHNNTIRNPWIMIWEWGDGVIGARPRVATTFIHEKYLLHVCIEREHIETIEQRSFFT